MKKACSIFFLALLYLGYKIWSYPLMDADEPRYAEAAKEMMEANQYLIPLADGELRMDKPILFYWFEILSFKIFGISEWAARLPSVIAGALTLGFVSWLGSFYRIGIWAPLILATSLEFMVISKMSITDATLNLFIVATLILFYLIYEKHIDERFVYLMAVMAALGFLTKGPIAVLIPGMVGALYLVARSIFFNHSKALTSDLWDLLRRHGLLTIVVFVVVAAPWYIAVHLTTAGEFTHYFFVGQNIDRFSSTLSGHDYPWWFYLLVMFVGFLPWSLFLPSLIAGFKLKPKISSLQIFALIWLLVVTLLFSFSSTKLANYVLSIFAPLSILFSLWINYSEQRRSVLINIGVYVLLLLGLGWSYGQGYLNKFLASEAFLENNIHVLQLAWFVILAVFILLALWLLRSGLGGAMKFFTGFALVLCLLGIDHLMLPFAHYKEDGIKNFLAQVPADVQIYLLTIDRPSVSFYSQSNKHPQKVGMKKIKRALAAGERFCLVAREDRKKKISNRKGLEIWFEDDIYIFACSFLNPKHQSSAN